MEYGILIAVQLIGIVSMVGINIHQNKKYLDSFNTLQKLIENMDELETPSAYEKERSHREQLFDERIKRLKDEVALDQTAARHGTIAPEFHPDVKNLPHEEIFLMFPDVEEVSE